MYHLYLFLICALITLNPTVSSAINGSSYWARITNVERIVLVKQKLILLVSLQNKQQALAIQSSDDSKWQLSIPFKNERYYNVASDDNVLLLTKKDYRDVISATLSSDLGKNWQLLNVINDNNYDIYDYKPFYEINNQKVFAIEKGLWQLDLSSQERQHFTAYDDQLLSDHISNYFFNGNHYYIAYNKIGLSVSHNAGKTWVHYLYNTNQNYLNHSLRAIVCPRNSICKRTDLLPAHISAMTADNSNIYLGQSLIDNHQPTRLIASFDNGETWQDLTAHSGLDEVFTINKIIAKSSHIYIGTNYGIYCTQNYGESWTHILPGISLKKADHALKSNVSSWKYNVNDMLLDNHHLYVAMNDRLYITTENCESSREIDVQLQ